MNRLNRTKQAQVIAALVEGNSIRSTERMTGIAKHTILKLLADLGPLCADFQDRALRNLTCRRIQVDEIWQFCYAKQKNVPLDKIEQFGIGNVWTWVAIDAETKLVPCWVLGGRDASAAETLMLDLRSRLANRVQLTTDGYKAYFEAVESAFGTDIDYSMLVKLYGQTPEGDTRYSPGECIGCKRERVMGNPDPAHVSTSYIERQNLTMRMSMRRFTRLTNGFSKKIENHGYALAIHYMHYNWCRMHGTLRCTPAMATGISDHVWEITEMLDKVGLK